MKYLLAKVIRVCIRYISYIVNLFNILLIKIKYPNISISLNTTLERGCIIRCSDNSQISLSNSIVSSGAIINADHGGVISIENSFIGRNCVIVARERIQIASDCQIAEMVVIRDQNHNFGDKTKTIDAQGFTTSPIIINRNVWLAAKVTVTAGSSIGENAIVGANAVVRGVLDTNSLYAGVPAQKIKSF